MKKLYSLERLGMERIWLKNYQKGVPYEINPDSYHSLVEVFEESCKKYPDRPAFVNMDKSLSFAEIERYTTIVASFFQKELDLRKGERVALMMPNILQYPIILFAALRLGLIVVNVNPLYTARELELQLNDAKASTIIVLANFAHTVSEILIEAPIKNIIVTELGDMFGVFKGAFINFVVKHVKDLVPSYYIPKMITWKKMMQIGKEYVELARKQNQTAFVKPIMSSEDIAFLQYTGGTTGQAKGAMLTHRNMIANLEQASSWVKPSIHTEEEIIITALPMYHIFSLTANCLTFFKMGALNVLITNPRDINSFVKEIAKFPFTAITGVNTLFNALLNHPKFSKVNFSHLAVSLGGGMAVQKTVAERWKAVTGNPLLEAYGLTEASPAVCINPIDLKDFNGSIGLPVSSTEISIRDEKGKELGFDESGELWVRGPQVMKGYWQKPEETKKVLTEDGWLKTGDIAQINKEGFIKIVDRKKDMILVSGFNVYPNEVEEVIASIPGVSEVAIIGIPYRGSERVKAFIVKKDAQLTEEDILEICRKGLTPYKIPKEIEFRKNLPKTPVGKILRRALREEEIKRLELDPSYKTQLTSYEVQE